MHHFKSFSLFAILLCSSSAIAQLTVSISPAKIIGQKAVVQLEIKNNLVDEIESARAVCFLLDDQGKIVGQSTKWVIGQNKAPLPSKREVKFNFVITTPLLVSSNLTAKVIFRRVILDSGKSIDPRQEVEITAATGNLELTPK